MDLKDIYRIFHPKIVEFILFSAAYGIFSKTDHILGHNVSLRNKPKRLYNPVHPIRSLWNETKNQQQE